MRQSEQLDQAEVAITQGRLEEAAATLLTLDVAPQLQKRLLSLNQKIDTNRLTGRVKKFEEFMAKGDKKSAERLLKELRTAGIDRKTLDRLEAMIDSPKTGAGKTRSSSTGRQASDQGPLRRPSCASPGAYRGGISD